MCRSLEARLSIAPMRRAADARSPLRRMKRNRSGSVPFEAQLGVALSFANRPGLLIFAAPEESAGAS